MSFYAQYGEESIIIPFFNGKTNGFFVDIGAMDGITYSNTRYLVEQYNWRGILVEPHPVFFETLKSLYGNNDQITILNNACLNKETEVDFFMYSTGQDACVSTISESFKNRVISKHGDKFEYHPVKTQTKTLNSIINNNLVDFLSVDAEGVDMEVLSSNDWTKNRPSLVCVEHSMETYVLIDFIKSINYKEYAKTSGNTFFIPQ
jgi:FkbM family methyltransferase